jgi:hypothetical protein
MNLVGFEPILSTGQRPQTYALRPRGHWDLPLKLHITEGGWKGVEWTVTEDRGIWRALVNLEGFMMRNS